MSEAPAPSSIASPPAATKTTQAIVFVGLSVAVFLICCSLLSLVLWYYWRKSRREYERYLHERRLAEEQRHKDGSVKQQVRLPVLIVNPDDEVEYGRKESRFFPYWSRSSKDGKQTAELPHTPPPGAYYIEGAPGFFEVDLEVGSEAKTTSPAVKAAKSPMELLVAAISKLSPRSPKPPEAVTVGAAQTVNSQPSIPRRIAESSSSPQSPSKNSQSRP